jgi:type I restriction enzyme S subunit
VSDLVYLERLLDGAAVEWVPLEKVADFVNGRAYKQQELLDDGKYPVLRVGNFFTNNNWYYSDLELEKDKYCDNGDLLYAWSASFGPRIWEGEKVIYHYHIWKVVPNPAVILKKFLYYLLAWDTDALKSEQAAGSTMLHITKGAIEQRLVPIPCPEDPQKSLAIQGEIVRILDAFTALTAELTAELTARKTQYNHYRNQLLSFEGGEVEWKTLGEIADHRRGTAITQKQTTDGKVPVVANGPVPTYYHGEHNRTGETVVVARSGAYAGYVSYWNEPIFLTDAFSVHPDPAVMTSRFVYYLLQNKQDQLYAMKKGAGVPHVRVKEVEEYEVPIPSLAEQARIVAILDKFDTLTTSLAEGLPREIALRKRQYEHYRNLLLGFPTGDKA